MLREIKRSNDINLGNVEISAIIYASKAQHCCNLQEIKEERAEGLRLEINGIRTAEEKFRC